MASYHSDQLQKNAQTHMTSPVKICYILSYKDPKYIRAQSQIAALSRCVGFEIILATNTSKGVLRYLQTAIALIKAKIQKKPDIYILGFRGHEIFWLIRWITKGKPLIFDALMSPYAALKFENKSGRIGNILAPIVRVLETQALKKSDVVLTDTRLHQDFYKQQFAVAESKIFALPVGAQEAGIKEAPCKSHPNHFTVLFYGSFLPLHGVDVIVQAAGLLRAYPIHFQFIGGKPKQLAQLHDLCRTHQVTRYQHRLWVPFEQLIKQEIHQASLCLGGPFGNTPQAQRVITTKTSQCLALGRPTVVGEINEAIGFKDKVNCLLVAQGDPQALADSIRWCFDNAQKLTEIGQKGQALYQDTLSVPVIAKQLEAIIKQAITMNEV